MTSWTRRLLGSVTLVATLAGAGCTSGPGGGGGPDAGPCDRVPVLTCHDTEPLFETCDEVYSAASASELTPLCEGTYEQIISGRCPLVQCCYHDDGLFGAPSLHCVSEDIDPSYRDYCLRNGGTYCPHSP